MMNRTIWPLVVACAAIVFALATSGASPASAHERRAINDQYMMVVGFLNEPAFVGLQNGLDLRIFTAPEGQDLETLPRDQRIGIEGLHETLQAEVIFGEQRMALELSPRFGDPGAYNGHFFPTVTGDYQFHIWGTVEGVEIDELFDSADGGFHGVEGVASLQFPEQVPTNDELASELASLRAAVSAGTTSAGGGSPAATAGDGDGGNAGVILGIIGIIVGATGLAAGGFALVRTRG